MTRNGDMVLLIEPWIPALRRYARSLVRDATEADDIVQDGLERAIGRWSQRRGDGEVRAWLFAIVHNLAITHLRRRARRGEAPLEAAAPDDLAMAAPQESRMAHLELLQALDEMPHDHRAVLLLVSVEGLPYGEAAKVLGVPLGTVMSRLSRAREALARRLRDGTGRASQLRVVQ